MEISFEHDGKQYKVSMEAYSKGRIVLPDGRLLEANAWGESLPPKPMGLHEVPNLASGRTPQEVAQLMNGVLAETITK